MKFNIQHATLKDTELLTRHRLNMWQDILQEPVTPVAGTEERTLEWIREKLSSGKLVGFLAKTEEDVKRLLLKDGFKSLVVTALKYRDEALAAMKSKDGMVT